MRGTIALGLGFLIYPFVFSNAFYLDIGVALLLAAISASAWNIVGGYAGQVSVGHCMFFGAGAYLPLLFYHHWQLPPLLGVPAGILVSLALAVLVGMPTFRLTGHYFSMATIAVAELIRLVIGTWDFVGAAIGLQGPAVGRGWWDLTFRGELPYYYIFLVVLAVLLFVIWAIERTRFGYYLRAIKAGDMSLLSWDRFEALAAVLAKREGSRVILTPRTADEGIDIVSSVGARASSPAFS